MASECQHCGRPITAIRGGRYCMARPCRVAAQHDYEIRRVRPGRATAPVPQPGHPSLPPLGILITDTDGTRVQCHACGRFFRALSGHVAVHGLTPGEYRATYELARTLSLAAPAVQDRLRELAIEHRISEQGRANLARASTAGRPRGTSARLSERIGKSKSRLATGD